MKALRRMLGLARCLKFFPNQPDVIINTTRWTDNSYSPMSMTVESRQLTAFNQLIVSGSMNVEWKKSDEFSIAIVAEVGRPKEITTTIRNNRLTIKLAEDYRGGIITVSVHCPDINYIEHHNPGDFLAKNVQNDSLEITKTSAGDLFIEGNTQRLTINNGGAGLIYIAGLDCQTATINQSGAGDIKINGNVETLFISQHAPGSINVKDLESEQITVIKSCPGDLDLKGTAEKLEIIHSGAGSINAKDLISQRLTLISSGSGSSKVAAKGEANISNKGAGNVNVYGKPRKVTQNGTGPGTINFH